MNYETALNMGGASRRVTKEQDLFRWLLNRKTTHSNNALERRGDYNLPVPHTVAIARYHHGLGAKRICDVMGMERRQVIPLLRLIKGCCQLDSDSRRQRGKGSRGLIGPQLPSPEEIAAMERKRIKREYLQEDKARAALKGMSVQMLRYYEGHEAAKGRAAYYARGRYHRLKHTPLYVIKRAARNVISRICRKTGTCRKPRTRTYAYLGCTYHEAQRHLEGMFRDGMTWENHGKHWEIDHILPLASFDLTDESQQMIALHFTNLQPLLVHENRAKRDYLPTRYTIESKATKGNCNAEVEGVESSFSASPC